MVGVIVVCYFTADDKNLLLSICAVSDIVVKIFNTDEAAVI